MFYIKLTPHNIFRNACCVSEDDIQSVTTEEYTSTKKISDYKEIIMKKSSKIIAVTSFTAVLAVVLTALFSTTAGGENTEPSVLYEGSTATVLSTEAETTTEGTEVL